MKSHQQEKQNSKPSYIVKGDENGRGAILIMDKPYKGVVIRYNSIKFVENMNGTATMKMDYDILDSCDTKEAILRASKTFETKVGDIAVDLVMEHDIQPKGKFETLKEFLGLK